MGLVEHCLLYVAFLFFFKKKVWRFPFQSYSAGYLDVSVIVYSESFNWTLCLPLFCRTSRFSATLWTVVFPFCNGNETFLVSKKKTELCLTDSAVSLCSGSMVKDFCILYGEQFLHTYRSVLLPFTILYDRISAALERWGQFHSSASLWCAKQCEPRKKDKLWPRLVSWSSDSHSHTDSSRKVWQGKARMCASHVKINFLLLLIQGNIKVSASQIYTNGLRFHVCCNRTGQQGK